MPKKNDGIINIKGKDYLTVARRVNDFRNDPRFEGFSLITQIVDRDEKTVVMSATVVDKEGRRIAVGHAEESRASSQINRTSALENCETSAIGRALAALGLGGTEFASANEVENAIHQQSNAPKKDVPKPSQACVTLLGRMHEAKDKEEAQALAKEAEGFTDADKELVRKAYYSKIGG